MTEKIQLRLHSLLPSKGCRGETLLAAFLHAESLAQVGSSQDTGVTYLGAQKPINQHSGIGCHFCLFSQTCLIGVSPGLGFS